MSTCTICRHALHGTLADATVCDLCEEWTRAQLTAIEALWPELPAYLQPGRGAGGPRVSGGSVEAPLPASAAVLNLTGAGGVIDQLARHDAAIRTARGLTGNPWAGNPDTRLAAILRSLRRHLPWSARHLDLGELSLTLRDLEGQMRGALGEGGHVTVKAGTCPMALADGTACGGAMRLNRDTREIWCRSCGRTVSPQLLANLAAAHARTADQAPAAR